MTKTANPCARNEPMLKTCHKIVFHRESPFAATIPQSIPFGVTGLSQDEIDEKLSCGFNDLAHGRCRPFADVNDDLVRDYGI